MASTRARLCDFCSSAFQIVPARDVPGARRFCSRHCLAMDKKRRWAAGASGRFWAKVDRSAGSSACWPFIGARLPSGYGKTAFDAHHILAHRLAFELECGPVPEGLYVCHHCDNPPCCNPAHLFAGTPRENQHDMIRKGRSRKKPRPGEANPRAKISEAQAIAIRCAPDTASAIALGSEFGLAQATVRQIRCGRLWKHLAGLPFDVVPAKEVE